jgi:hypothetical protein
VAPAREAAGGTIAPLNAARTAQRAVPTRFRGSKREISFRRNLTPALSSFGKERENNGGSVKLRAGIQSEGKWWMISYDFILQQKKFLKPSETKK